MDATNMIPAYSLVDDGDFYTMKTENGGVHYLLPELFLPLGSIHHQIYIDAMQPHPISGHIPLNVCIWCIIQSFSQFFVNGKQLSLQVVTIIRNPYLEAIAHCFFPTPWSILTVSMESSDISMRSVLFIRQDDKQQSNKVIQTLFMAFCF